VTAEEHLANDPTSELWGEHRSRYRFAEQFVHGKRVLDVASGAGFGMQMLRAAGACPVGVDYDRDALREVRRIEPQATLVHADATRMPFGDAAIDVVVSFETLEHVQDAGAMVREIRRVLKPAGCLVLSTPNRAFGPPERHTHNPFHVREFTASELRDLLCASFSTVDLYGQRPARHYRYVPYLMIDAHVEPAALLWKLQLRLPREMRERIAALVSGRPFYPDERNYTFDHDQTDGAHALVAVAR
jgi:ubiquinone/menaquinone biosynthesis C-methylase UbiE